MFFLDPWIRKATLIGVMAACVSLASAQLAASPDSGPNAAGQSIADALRSATGADAAFVAAGLMKDANTQATLDHALEYPSDDVAVVAMRGSQIQQALERSISLYPAPNASFLQVSGLEVTYSKSAAANSRVVSITIAGAKMEPNRTYQVAMPGLLARGGLGFFKVWNRDQAKPFSGVASMEALLRGRRAADSAPRWIAQ